MFGNTVTIIGGGLSGCSLAAQLSDQAEKPLKINIIEPRSVLGAGVAYSADDIDHRLNAPLFVHFLTPDRAEEFQNWFVDSGGLNRDPDALAADGNIYARRTEFADYVSEKMADYHQANPSNSTITHLQEKAVDILPITNGYRILTESGSNIESDAVVLATGNRSPAAPSPFDKELEDHPAFIVSPWDLEKIRNIDENTNVLIIGAGLTMSDVVATLSRQGHNGTITAVSRNGQIPKTHAPPPEDATPRHPFDGVMEDKPPHLDGSLLEVFVNLRKRMKEDMAADGYWHWAFDELRDCVWQIWPHFSEREKRQYLRYLRPWYDSHRFRLPPQTAHILDDALERNILTYKTGHVVSALDRGKQIEVRLNIHPDSQFEDHRFDAIINCTGPVLSPAKTKNPIYQSILRRDLVKETTINIGFDVDAHCRAISKYGVPQKNLFIVGSPTVGVFGDPIGAPFIIAQIWRMAPTLLQTLSSK
ncbi:MAG: SidA/IucD/PvdA family monooxygenase [Rhodospirillaceae bacterium]|nr:SidA/IucD/PvdA family monooxygenase [Rhodospirillaceae bacterium]